jgi:hypothetical protein
MLQMDKQKKDEPLQKRREAYLKRKPGHVFIPKRRI